MQMKLWYYITQRLIHKSCFICFQHERDIKKQNNEHEIIECISIRKPILCKLEIELKYTNTLVSLGIRDSDGNRNAAGVALCLEIWYPGKHTYQPRVNLE